MTETNKLTKLDLLKLRAKELKRKVGVLYLAFQNPKTPWYAKLLIGVVVSYALSPIDLVPDFIPVLGYLDDLILIPAGIALSIKLIPAEVINECEEKIDQIPNLKEKGIYAALVILLIWLLIIYGLIKIFIS